MDNPSFTDRVLDYTDYVLDVLSTKYGVDLSVVSIYIFLTEPTSSKWAFRWNLFLAVFVALYIILILVESCDGPNKYVDRSEESLYPFLLTNHEYWTVTIMCWSPLLLDASVRIVLLSVIFGHSSNDDIAEELLDNKFTLVSMFGDIICIFPFLLRAGYLQPHQVILKQGPRVLIRIIELLSISRILRSTKDIPAIKAIRITLSRAVYHLIMPIFFFFAFNVFAAVILYFIEPCYNTSTCPWLDLFGASFFSVVTMTTTGYGNQVPYYLTTRVLACIIMIFGSLFISLPLAIIGNEYDEAWTEVSSEAEAAAAKNEEGDGSSAIVAAQVNDGDKEADEKKSFQEDRNQALSPVISEDSDSSESEDELANKYTHVCSIVSVVSLEFEDLGSVSPSMLLQLCELRGWLSSLKWQISNCMRSAVTVKKYILRSHPPSNTPSVPAKPPVAGRRRLSVLASSSNRAQVVPVDASGKPSLLNRGDSIIQDINRMRSISDISESSVGDIEMGSPADATRTAVVVPEKGSTQPEQSKKKVSRTTFRGITTLFRDQLELVSSEHGDSQTKKRLPARSILLMLAKASRDVIPGGSHSADFTKKMVRAARNPNSLRSRLWMLLELPSSSKEAMGLRYVLMFLIMLSVFTLYTQTLTSLSSYGERSDVCGKVLFAYCSDKNDPALDPGCFNQNVDVDQKLKFRNCDDDSDENCFRRGFNFGSPATNYTCDDGGMKPFRSQEELYREYGVPSIRNTREDSHRIYAICSRVECSNSFASSSNGNAFWVPLEIVMNIVFTVELVLRIVVAESYKDFALDFLNVFDVFSIIPFYAEVASYNKVEGLDFAILASSPDALILVAMKALKVFRLFKITRHFKAAQVLVETAQKVWRQLIGMLSFLLFIITVFAILLFEVEQGTGCYVGDSNCKIPADVAGRFRDGSFVLLNKQGNISQFSNALYGLWFSMVSMTSTGYGDIVPSTNAGLVMAVFLMLFGSMYMAMPLTAAASVFYVIHESYNESKQKKKGGGKDDKRNKSTLDAIHVKSGSVSRVIGGNRDRGKTPDPKIISVVQRALNDKEQKILSDRVALSGMFTIAMQHRLELLRAKCTTISSKIESFLKNLQQNGDDDMPIVDQLAEILEIAAATFTNEALEDLVVVSDLSKEIFKISLDKNK